MNAKDIAALSFEDAVLMGVVDHVAHLGHQAERLADGTVAGAFDLVDPVAFDIFHHEEIAALMDASSKRLDPDRLHQEAILLASKADIREELDRLAAHVAQSRKLVADGGAVGRRLDFLAQELNRESNTLCAKANDVELTNIGLELKAVVEQFREQVQNLE